MYPVATMAGHWRPSSSPAMQGLRGSWLRGGTGCGVRRLGRSTPIPTFPLKRKESALRNVSAQVALPGPRRRSEEHTSELQSLMRISYAVFCLKKKNKKHEHTE